MTGKGGREREATSSVGEDKEQRNDFSPLFRSFFALRSVESVCTLSQPVYCASRSLEWDWNISVALLKIAVLASSRVSLLRPRDEQASIGNYTTKSAKNMNKD